MREAGEEDREQQKKKHACEMEKAGWELWCGKLSAENRGVLREVRALPWWTKLVGPVGPVGEPILFVVVVVVVVLLPPC